MTNEAQNAQQSEPALEYASPDAYEEDAIPSWAKSYPEGIQAFVGYNGLNDEGRPIMEIFNRELAKLSMAHNGVPAYLFLIARDQFIKDWYRVISWSNSLSRTIDGLKNPQGEDSE